MVALVRKTRFHFTRWCSEFLAKNKAEHPWYEADHTGFG